MFSIKQILLAGGLLLSAGSAFAQSWVNHNTSDGSAVVERHETGSVVSGNKLYVMGGRGDRPVQVYDGAQNKWSTLAPLPIELHHFQAVVLDNYIYVIGAFTCCYPNEPSVADIYRLNLANNTWETHGTIPAARLRGAAGATAHNGKIYLVGGNTEGHSGGAVPWFDEYDPETGNWTTLPDAPNARDHFNTVVVGNKLVAASGRQSNRSFGGLVADTDVYDFTTNTWNSVAAIPTLRAGAMLSVKSGNIVIMGGESNNQQAAHDEVEAFNVASNTWRDLPSLRQGRHSGAAGLIGNILHVVTGNRNRGGGQEIASHETLNLSDADNDGLFDFEDNSTNIELDSDNDGLNDDVESQLGTDPGNTDSDGDTLSDGDEVNNHQSDPLSSDTDNDGLQDAEEVNLGTDLTGSDTDEDGLSDIDEVQTHGTNPNNADTDSDGLTDTDELQVYFTDPLLTDSDNDGLDDNVEVLELNSDPNAWDSDGDGKSDAEEAANGSTINDADEDGDGISNSAEGDGDTDNDSIPNYADLDSDNDGIPDIVENGRTDNNNDGLVDASDTTPAGNVLLDDDQDGIPNMLDLDSDQDGSADLIEAGRDAGSDVLKITDLTDSNSNGWHDAFEGLSLKDTDADTIPDFLDLDSNDDGITDVADTGLIDSDNDGRLDTVTDNNGDGIHDDIPTLVVDTSDESDGNTTENEPDASSETGSDADSQTDEQQIAEDTSGGGSDPLLPLILLLGTILHGMVRTRS